MYFKKLFKFTIFIVIMTLVGYFIYTNKQIILNKIDYYYKKYFQTKIKQNLTSNAYQKKQDYKYVKIYNDVIIKNKEDLKNSIYTYLDAGWDKYTVVCDVDYLTCTDDAKSLVADKEYLTNISNFVSPFNTFDEFNTSISQGGQITFSKEKRYSLEQIEDINKMIDKIYNENYDSSKNAIENIKIFHDYIINNTKYDKQNTTGASSISSSTAYGVLYNGLGICSGYSDTMSLFLDKMNIKNYRISSKEHVWNFVYIEGQWKHLDLTWDDPTSDDDKDTLTYEYYLIPTVDLISKNTKEHSYNNNIYIEAK